MKISFVIPAHNEEAWIGPTIESILRQPPNLLKEIIVVDNNSTDRTAEIAESYLNIKVMSERNFGTNWARQTGLEAASGDIVAFIDADNRLPPAWSQKAIYYLTKPGVAGVSGPYDFPDQNWFMRLVYFYGFILIAYPIHLFFNSVLKIGGIVSGGNVAAKRETLLKVGGLDTQYRFFGDDTSTSKRLRRVGRLLYTPNLYVYSTSRRVRRHGFFKTMFQYAINLFWVMFFDKPFNK